MSTLATQRFSGLYQEHVSEKDLRLRQFQQGRLLGLRNNRYSWWTHARELADFILPRRYKWLITQNQQNRGSPINQHILDSTGTLAARKPCCWDDVRHIFPYTALVQAKDRTLRLHTDVSGLVVVSRM